MCQKNNINSLIGMIILFLLTACGDSPREPMLSAEHKAFTKQVQLAVADFSHLHQADTLDFVSFNKFAWDSLYIFSGYLSKNDLYRTWGWIDWQPVLDNSGVVPEHITRFVFVWKDRAVNYIDVNDSLIREVHYFKYFKDERGYLQPYKSLFASPHNMPVNCFAKRDTKFILVCPVHVPIADSTEFVFAQAEFFTKKPALLQKAMADFALNMHPIRGCGYPNCWANHTSNQAAKAVNFGK